MPANKATAAAPPITSTVVLDASAVLAMLQDEPGADVVAGVLTRGCIASVNATEVLTRLIDRGAPAAIALATFEMLRLDVIAVDRDIAVAAATLRAPTRANGLSLGDRVCLALGQHLGATIFTADRAWSDANLGLDVRQIR
jgi:ribonuclease VapC